MKKIILFLLICLYILPVNGFGEKYALLVGIDDYPRNSLNGCIADVKMMEKLLIDDFDFPRENVKTLLDNQATFSGINRGFSDHLLSKARAGDVVVFYFSGHGTVTKDFSGDESDRYDEALCPIDISGVDSDTWLTDDKLASWLSQLSTDKVTVILDACHSGTGTRDFMGLKVKSMDIGFTGLEKGDTKIIAKSKQTNFYDPDMSHILISACAPDEVAQVRDANGSVLTSFLYEVLKDSDKEATYEDFMMALVDKVKGNGYAQNPQLEGDYNYSIFYEKESEETPEPEPTPSPPEEVTAEETSEVVQEDDFAIELSTNKTHYHPGDLMTITVTPEKDCYLRLYHASADKKVQQIFPNKWQQDNFLNAGQTVKIPGENAEFQFRMSAPFGVEAIKAVASTVQFKDLKSVDYDDKVFIDFGDMRLSEINTKGLEVVKKPLISQSVVLYDIKE